VATYVYTARDMSGRVITGAVEGDTELAVVGRLKESGYFITTLRRQAKQPTVEELLVRLRGVRLKDLAIFTRQLATMINAGLTITMCLSILEQQSSNRRLMEVIRLLRTDVEGGLPLSDALAKHPDEFSSLYINMVRAGETGGVLDEVLTRLASLLEKELALRQKVRAAMVYPTVIATAAVGIVSFIVFFILPKFAALFQDLDVPLPAPTRFLIWVTVTAQHSWYIMILVLISGVYGLRYYIHTPPGRAWFDRTKLRVPLFGNINRNVLMTRFARTFGTLTNSGVPILQALDVVSKAVDNVIVSQAIASVRASIREGETIAGPLQASGIFPPMVVQMVSVGERTGGLDAMLGKVADFYDTEVEYAVAGLTSILEPALIMVLGGVVGFIVISFYLPLFNLVGAIK
jgi:type IV pilus assembly protein PilC